ncbi:glycoside hydrolase family 13 protein [Lachnoclostridium phytofermentans]|uniref:Alpha amylase catalytic region n=1 Tax=Lachnoclostridium phytofermentans (strain ATCC 700394 / DSM 18823 / ISDg) TaxID=357809 RepID=A9KKX9_LACP7|nr:glycoside hydrolase family 13 protein [Lachnoclostridium phytofermentans]ABX42711.1 alpha amylase catalytic region [Lachnoclostridium phytofermentans ISDg]
MKFEAIYHRTSDNYCYPLNEEDLIINIKTGHDIERVFIYYGDPFEGGILGGNWTWNGVEEELIYKKNLTHHIWWTTTVKPKFKRCKYYFKLVANDTSYYYFEDGFYTEAEMNHQDKNLVYFTFPWMNSIDINKTPDWVNDTVWYQIFPERFNNGDKENDPKNVKAWGFHTVSNDEFYGGDLQGIINRLDYLADIGISGIYLTPIFEANTSHKYDTKDYMKIDPHFGDEKVFKNLVDTAHEKGIRIMLDGVFNHCGNQFAPWLDVLKNGPDSKYFNWFMINKWPFNKEDHNTNDGSFYSFAFTSRMPKLNTNNPEVIKYLLDVVEYWVKNFDIDGIRLDVANEISHRFCKDLRKLTKELKPDFYILGELWHDAITWLHGDEFDGVMNYPLATSLADYWVYPEKTNYDFECAINHNFTMYMQQTNDVLFNLLDSHDTNRLIDKVKDIDIFYQQLAVLFTMPGSPCIYYGTEIAMEGSYDPDCRRCMPWEDIDAGLFKDRIEIIKALIHLRKTNNAFKSRHYHFIEDKNNNRVIHYIKTDEDHKQVEVILNCSKDSIVVQRKGNELFSLLNEDTILKPKGVFIQQI